MFYSILFLNLIYKGRTGADLIKKIWHITTATHNSRYSQRMFDNKVKLGEPRWLSEKEELVIAETIAKIVKCDDISIPAYNICGDHMHFVLVCEENEVSKIVGKIKAMSARAANIEMGYTTTASSRTRTTPTRGHAPLSGSVEGSSESSVEGSAESSAGGGSASFSGIPSLSDIGGSTRGVSQCHLWTQKFGKKEILDNNQYRNTVNYILNNRIKHKLPENKKLQGIIKGFTKQ